MTQRHILVVDDHQDIRDLTALVLGDAGYRTTTACSGREALARLGSEPFDLVLLDVNMPDMDGWETLRLLRADDDLVGLGVLMFTIKNEIEDRVHSLQEGASGYVTKPFVTEDLLERVRRAIEASGGGERGREGFQ